MADNLASIDRVEPNFGISDNSSQLNLSNLEKRLNPDTLFQLRRIRKVCAEEFEWAASYLQYYITYRSNVIKQHGGQYGEFRCDVKPNSLKIRIYPYYEYMSYDEAKDIASSGLEVNDHDREWHMADAEIIAEDDDDVDSAIDILRDLYEKSDKAYLEEQQEEAS